MINKLKFSELNSSTVLFDKKDIKKEPAKMQELLQALGIHGDINGKSKDLFKLLDGIVDGEKADGQITYAELQELEAKLNDGSNDGFISKFKKKFGDIFLDTEGSYKKGLAVEEAEGRNSIQKQKEQQKTQAELPNLLQ